jgi:hypothetical protein
LIGALASALILGPILLRLNDAATVYVPIAEVAPGLMATGELPAERVGLSGPQGVSDPGSVSSLAEGRRRGRTGGQVPDR